MIEAGDRLHVLVRQEARGGLRRADAPLARRADRPRARRRPVGTRAVSIFSTGRGWPSTATRRRPERVDGRRRHRPAAHAPRRPGRARRPRRRALRRTPARSRRSARRASCQDAARKRLRAGRRRRRAGVVARGHRRARRRMGPDGLTSVLGRAYSRAPKDGTPHLLPSFPPSEERYADEHDAGDPGPATSSAWPSWVTSRS